MFLVLLSFFAVVNTQGNGDGQSLYASRVFHVLFNLLRMDPASFGNRYSIYYDGFDSMNNISLASALQGVSPVNPVYLTTSGSVALQAGLNSQAQSCSTQLGSDTACDGSALSSAVGSAYCNVQLSLFGTYSNEVDSISAVTAFVCNGDLPDQCRPQPSSLFQTSVQAESLAIATGSMGGGYGFGGGGGTHGAKAYYYRYYHACVSSEEATQSPIYGGTHVFYSSLYVTNQYTFMANYYSPSSVSPQSATLILNGVSVSMSLDTGTATRGTYIAYQMLDSTMCGSYFFRFVVGGTTYDYPENGVLQTNFGYDANEDACNGVDYIVQSHGVVPSPSFSIQPQPPPPSMSGYAPYMTGAPNTPATAPISLAGCTAASVAGCRSQCTATQMFQTCTCISGVAKATCVDATPATPSTAAANNNNNNKMSPGAAGGLGTGAIVGIAIGGVCCCLLLCAVVVFVLRRRASDDDSDDDDEGEQYTPKLAMQEDGSARGSSNTSYDNASKNTLNNTYNNNNNDDNNDAMKKVKRGTTSMAPPSDEYVMSFD